MLKLILILTVLLSPWTLADQKDQRLPELFMQLKASENEQDAGLIAIRIWDIWQSHPDPEIDEMMFYAMDELGGGQYRMSLLSFTAIIRLDPEFAEAWNMRATAHFLLGNYLESEQDIMRTLELEPNHFGALEGLSQVYVETGRYLEAQNAILRALEIYPANPVLLANLQALQRFLDDSIVI